MPGEDRNQADRTWPSLKFTAIAPVTAERWRPG